MLIGSRFGVHGLICGAILTSYLYTFIVIRINANLLGRSAMKQFVTLAKNIFVATLVGMIVFVLCRNINASIYVYLITSVVAYIAIYLFTSYVFRISGFNMCLRIIKKQK
jgi:hypothetical protein